MNRSIKLAIQVLIGATVFSAIPGEILAQNAPPGEVFIPNIISSGPRRGGSYLNIPQGANEKKGNKEAPKKQKQQQKQKKSNGKNKKR